MKVSVGLLCLGTLVAFAVYLFCGRVASADERSAGPVLLYEEGHDTSIPVRYLASVSVGSDERQALPVRRSPFPPRRSAATDPAVQHEILPPVSATTVLNFDGIRDVDGVAAPDTGVSAGATQVVEVVNKSYQVFDKSTGKSIFGPAEVSSIWSGFVGDCGLGSTGSYRNPIVLYDKAAGRWLITIVASSDGFSTGTECIAVSTTSDATGSYNRYGYAFAPNLNDVPKFGVWPDAYYASYNMYNSQTFLGAQGCAYDRTKMLSGSAATAVCFLKSTDFGLLPSDLDGTTLNTSGEPNFFAELTPGTASRSSLFEFDETLATPSLSLFKFHVNFATPSLSTFTGPTAITVAAFATACGGGACIPQPPGDGTLLDSLADRLMFRLAYRNFSDHEALVVTHSVKGSKAVSNVRWYEIRSPGTIPTIFQQGTFAYQNVALWMASIGMDKAGDIALGMSGSSRTVHPSIGYTGRVPSDPLGKMESPAIVKLGSGSQTGGVTHWGEHSSMSIDPSDDCTFWYAQEYLSSDGSLNWRTRLASFKFKSCQ